MMGEVGAQFGEFGVDVGFAKRAGWVGFIVVVKAAVAGFEGDQWQDFCDKRRVEFGG